jgi:hypothetical protein
LTVVRLWPKKRSGSTLPIPLEPPVRPTPWITGFAVFVNTRNACKKKSVTIAK